MQTNSDTVAVLGAYGLAGRAIVERLAARTGYRIVAAGRDAAKLHAQTAAYDRGRVRACVLDAEDAGAVREACAGAAFAINAVGPFARNGAAIARAVLDAGVPYLDCANEQSHYRALQSLDGVARARGLPLVTGTGAIPGLSSLLAADTLRECAEPESLDIAWAQFRHAYAESGLGSVMGGLLEAAAGAAAWRDGAARPVRIGASMRDAVLPAPFGTLRLFELPTIDDLVVPARFPLREMHTWFYLGDLPVYLLALVRWLQPARRPRVYRLVEAIMRRINDRETRHAIARGIGPEALLSVEVHARAGTRTRRLRFVDGAAATACLPVHIADAWLRGAWRAAGLLTPLDIADPKALPGIVEGAAIEASEEVP